MTPLHKKILAAFRQGRYYDNVMDSGTELERLKAWLHKLDAPERSFTRWQNPILPPFEGLAALPVHATDTIGAAAILTRHADTIRAELLAADEALMFAYYPKGKPADITTTQENLWKVLLFSYMGMPNRRALRQFPQTAALIAGLPDVCLAYPWGDALLSLHYPNTHLHAHCSVDNLRIRIHLGIQVTPSSRIRVAEHDMRWQEGQCLVFDDSFEHEVWNGPEGKRSVLIVDVWHPDLTVIEREALLAGFCKQEVRSLFWLDRLRNLEGPDLARFRGDLEHRIASESLAAPLARYWA